MRLPITTLLVAFASASLVAQVPDISGILRRAPSLSRFFQPTPALTTGFDDTARPVPMLNRREWRKARPMTELARTADGGYKLEPGLWEGTFEGYCLHAAAYGPNAGQGYLVAPYKGSRAKAVQTILQTAMRHPEIDRGQIQLLLWSVLARLKSTEMRDDVAATARVLLPAAELKSLDRDALDVVPPSQRARLFGMVPEDIRKAVEIENEIRYKLNQNSSTYEEIAELAVPGPAPLDPNDRLKRGEWSRHPDGYYIRYFPNGYTEMKVQILIPEGGSRIERDRLNRITAIQDAHGGRTETEYDDTIAPRRLDHLGLTAYRFKTIRLIRPRASGGPEVVEVKNQGWTFHKSKPRAPRQAAALMSLVPKPALAFLAAELGLVQDWDAWAERAESAQEIHDDFEWYRERWENNTERPSEDAVDNLEDTEHYRDGVDAALNGGLGDQLDWLIDHQERENAALEHATNVLDSLPTTSTVDDPIVIVIPPRERSWFPWSTVAVPSDDDQRLGTGR